MDETPPICKTCDDTGWVCEAHPDRPWAGVSNRKDACAHGPGVPCPDCVEPGECPDLSRAGVTILAEV